MKRLAATLATMWRLAIPYFRSEDRWPGRLLLGAVVAIELSIVAINVILNYWYNGFYNTLQNRDWNGFIWYILVFCGLAAVYTVLAVYQNYLNLWLQIRWRRWMTQTYLRQWLNTANHYRMQLLGDAADNPDQRIADDLQMFVQSTLSIGLGLLSSCVTLCSFVVILWKLSEAAPLHLFGVSLAIPGYLVWAALLYAVIGTALTHLIGWPLIPLNFLQQRYEADFRFNLVRTRENSEQIAALHGEAAERERHLGRFGLVVSNWIAIMQRQKQLTFFTQSYSQASVIFPYLMVSPAYFSGAMQLGGLMQTASAFNSVQTALSYFVTAYQSIAQYRAVVTRLSGFEEAIVAGRDVALTPPAVEVLRRETPNVISLDQLRVRLPNGEPLVNAENIVFVARRARIGYRAVGRRQVDTIPRRGRHLAVWFGPRNGAARRQDDAIAAAAVFPGGLACRRGQLSGHEPARSPTPASPRWSRRSGFPNGAESLMRKRIGTGCCRKASSNASPLPARSCRNPIISSSTKPPLRLTSPRRPRCTGCCRSGSKARR